MDIRQMTALVKERVTTMERKKLYLFSLIAGAGKKASA